MNRLPFQRSVPLTFLAVVAHLATAACVASATDPPKSTTVRAQHGVVVSVSREASEIGLAVLKSGGNAVDSAIATAFALQVSFPEAGNIGGGGFMMVLPAVGAEPVCIDYRETAPAAAHPEMYVGHSAKYGHTTVAVPGTVRGLELAHQRFGTLPWRELVLPAARLAGEGFAVGAPLVERLNRILDSTRDNAEFQRVYGPPAGTKWSEGDRLVQPELAGTLRRIAELGPDEFYIGAVGAQIAGEVRAGGGILAASDLAGYRAIGRRPVHGTYRGFDIYGVPPPSSGGTCVVEMLNILETFDLRSRDRWSAENAHLEVEAMRRAFLDRARYLGDPAFVDVPDRLVTKDYARQLAAGINPSRATASASLATDLVAGDEGESTTHFSIADRRGMVVANTYTLQDSWGSRVVVRGGGFLLNNEMTDFNSIPGHTDQRGRIGTSANLIAPGKRMLSSQSPTIVLRDGRPFLATGSPGGRTIPNTVLSVLLSVLEYGEDVRRAVDAPRLDQQWMPDRVRFEGAQDPKFASLVEQLRAMGHTVESPPDPQGDAHSIQFDGEWMIGAADHRRDGHAAGY